MVHVALDSCKEEGDISLGEEVPSSDTITYRLLKVCLFGHWSYVCHDRFNNIDRSIVLNQLGCDGGSKLLARDLSIVTIILLCMQLH